MENRRLRSRTCFWRGGKPCFGRCGEGPVLEIALAPLGRGRGGEAEDKEGAAVDEGAELLADGRGGHALDGEELGAAAAGVGVVLDAARVHG